MPRAYYNEREKYAAKWLQILIDAGLIAYGDVDDRDIRDVSPGDLVGYSQCHFFAGIGGWSLALRIAGVPDAAPVWTGSCPCQPFSAAGKQKGEADERHLWPDFARLIRECGPSVVFGEQVASRLGREWLSGVRLDLERMGYAVGAADLCAASVSAPHIRQRLFWGGWLANAYGRLGNSATQGQGRRGICGPCEGGGPDAKRASGEFARSGESDLRWLPDADGQRFPERPEYDGHAFARLVSQSGDDPFGPWGNCWLGGPDGKARRVEPGIRLLAHGVPARVGKLRAGGNAIVPQVAAEFVSAFIGACADA